MKSNLVSTSMHRLRTEPPCIEESQRWASVKRPEVKRKFHIKVVRVKGEGLQFIIVGLYLISAIEIPTSYCFRHIEPRFLIMTLSDSTRLMAHSGPLTYRYPLR